MEIDKVRELTEAELTDELVKQRRHLYDLRFQLATRQLTDYSQLTRTRRTIARILTVATEREQTGAGPVASTRPARTARDERDGGRRGGARTRAADSPERGDNDTKADTAATATAEKPARTRRGRGASE
jgi:large subunit ribosomal protein L29